MTDHSFQVNLRGIIDLLSGHLYSGPHVYIRELMQNAVDAIAARRLDDPDLNGRIGFEIVGGADQGTATLVVTDNGVGLTEDEVHEFLATIGQSSKRDPTVDRDTFIGQFGIGLLSSFMVSEEVVLITRSVQEGAATVEWTGRADGTYSVRQLDYDFEPGSQVYLRAKPGCGDFFDPAFVERIARHYGGFLPESIEIRSGESSVTINERPPWLPSEETGVFEREESLEFGREFLDEPLMDAIPLHSDEGGIQGIAFVREYASTAASRSKHRVYLKNMLVSEQAEGLLPDWAFFVRCVLNVSDLKPTASREAFHDDEHLELAQGQLGNALRSWLMDLAESDRARLNQIISLHYMAMKGLAVEDDEFFRIFIDWLPFETSLGHITLEELQQHDSTIRFASTRDQFRQISGVASAQGMYVVNAGYQYDEELLRKIPQVFPDREVEQIDVNELSQEFADLTLDEQSLAAEFVKTANEALEPFQCDTDIRRFDPESIPVLYTTSEAATFLRSVEQSKEVSDELWSGILNDITNSEGAAAQLCFNFSNPLVQRLVALKNRELIRRGVEMLYVQALLLGHYPMRASEMKLLNTGLLGLINYCVDLASGS